MDYIFKIIDKSNREIRFTEKQWKHVLRRHYDMINYQDEIKETLKNPDKIINHPFDDEARYYFKYLKNQKNNGAPTLLSVGLLQPLVFRMLKN